MENFDAQAPVLIATAFPQYTFEEIESWTREKIIKRCVQAEWQFQNIRGMKGWTLTKTVEEGDEPAEEVKMPTLSEEAWRLLREGYDPMLIFNEMFPKQKTPYVERPIIGGLGQTAGMLAGVDAWRKGVSSNGRYRTVQEQVQKVSGGRGGYVPQESGTDDE
jgi:hypothetical protein